MKNKDRQRNEYRQINKDVNRQRNKDVLTEREIKAHIETGRNRKLMTANEQKDGVGWWHFLRICLLTLNNSSIVIAGSDASRNRSTAHKSYI